MRTSPGIPALTSIPFSAVAEQSWPPKNPREALLSSPSGRRKFQEMQSRRSTNDLRSPLKRSATTPNLRAKAQQFLHDGADGHDDDDEEEDEETLQLKLAAIEARLKLKRLQRAKSGHSSSDMEGDDSHSQRPATAGSASAAARSSQSRLHTARETKVPNGKTEKDDVQVPLSPTRKPAPVHDPLSPSRFLLGIDKGMRGKDVSLRRPPTSKNATRPVSMHEHPESATSRASGYDHGPRDAFSSTTDQGIRRGKTFSERIAESRSMDKARQERAERAEEIKRNRSSAFQFDKAEMERFKAAAAETKEVSPKLPTRTRPTESFSREDVLRSFNQPTLTRKRSQTAPSVPNHGLGTYSYGSEDKPSYLHRRTVQSEADSQPSDARVYQFRTKAEASEKEEAHTKAPGTSKFEPYSSLHLSSRILPHSFLERTLESKTILRIPDLLKTVKAPDFELPTDIDGDYVVFGIVASKSAPREHKEAKNVTTKEVDPYDDGLNNTNKYMAITLTDLKWTVDLFLFDTAFPRYYRLSEGILIAILNPTIMPPPPNKIDTNRFSLSISSSDDKILEIGYAQDIGFCKAVRKDGKTCQAWVDARKTEFCDFHVDVQIRRTQSQRMGVNGGTGMFGPGGRSGPRTGFFGDGGARRGGGYSRGGGGLKALKPEGAQYDRETQSVYYVAQAPSPANSNNHAHSYFNRFNGHGRSAANLIDGDNNNDPFIMSDMTGRGMESKQERLRRRLAEQQRERDIAKKLVSSGGASGVGAEYLRARVGENTKLTTSSSSSSGTASSDKSKSTTTTTTTNSSATPSTATNRLSWTTARKADTVRLSPMKRVHDGDTKTTGSGSGVKKTRFITANGIREAGRDSIGSPVDPRRKPPPSAAVDDDDDELDII